jgi:uncharacterized membrane protein (DUF2068 family)
MITAAIYIALFFLASFGVYQVTPGTGLARFIASSIFFGCLLSAIYLIVVVAKMGLAT